MLVVIVHLRASHVLWCFSSPPSPFFFFFNDTATTEIYTLSLHDALPIYDSCPCKADWSLCAKASQSSPGDRKSTRLNSSHSQISYAVFCLKKKKIHTFKPSRSDTDALPATSACAAQVTQTTI